MDTITTNPAVEQALDAIYNSGLRHLPRGEKDIWDHMRESEEIDVDDVTISRYGAQVLEWLANLAAGDLSMRMTVRVRQTTVDGSEAKTIGGTFNDSGEYVGGYALRSFELLVARNVTVLNPQMSDHGIALTEYRGIQVGYDVHPDCERVFGRVSLPEIGTGTVHEALTPLVTSLVNTVQYLK